MTILEDYAERAVLVHVRHAGSDRQKPERENQALSATAVGTGLQKNQRHFI